ncbi:MAG: SpoIID/LytB domain-containing protein [Actinomycetes bacterium]
MLRRTALLGLTATLLTAGSALTALPSGAASAEIYPVPSDGTFDLSGRGYGHGIGMSQYGAKVGAEQGNDATTILSAYYPGTTLRDVGDPTMRVALSADGYGTTRTSPTSAPFFRVRAESGLTVVDYRGSGATRSAAAPTDVGGSPVTTWGVSLASGTMNLHAFYGGAWHRHPVSGPDGAVGDDSGGAIEFSSVSGQLTMRGLDGNAYRYRGHLRASAYTSSSMVRLNIVPIEDYLLGVVPSEMPPTWHRNAVLAQSVAARTFAESRRKARDGQTWHVDDTVSSQVYRGVSGENNAATIKIESGTDVLGKILTVNGTAINAMFGSSNGGWEVSGERSYLPARADSWDPVNHWTATLTASCLTSTYGGGHALQRLVVTKRDGHGALGGRVTGVRLEFAGGGTRSFTASGAYAAAQEVRLGLGVCDTITSTSYLKTNWFGIGGGTPTPTPTPTPTLSPAVTDPHLRFGVAPIAPGKALVATRASDSSVWLRTWTASGGLGTPTKLGGNVWSAPAVIAGPDGRVEVYARYAGSNRLRMRVRQETGAAWSPWKDLGGSLRSNPTVAAAANGRVFVFARGRSGLVYRSHSASGTWTPWGSLGGRLHSVGGPAAVATADGRIHVVVHRADHRVGLRTRSSSGWSTWKDLGARITGTPAVASDRRGRFTLVVRGADERAHTTDVVGRQRGSWRTLGGSVTGSPVVTGLPGTARVDVLANLGTTPLLYSRSRVAGTWSAWHRSD